MYIAAFHWLPGQYDEEFHRLNAEIDAVARANPGFIAAESWYGATVGKRLLGFRVETVAGQRIGLDKAFLRNLSKLHWVLLLLDVLVGLGTTGDPRQKFSDRFAGTRVVPAT